MSDQPNPGEFRVARLRSACNDCGLVQLCLPVSLDSADVDRLDQIVQPRRPIKRHEHLYRTGDGFGAIYVVRTGALKTYTLSEGGEEQIMGFHLPGEVVGLDAINEGSHPCGAQALETTTVCEVPFERLEALSTRIPGLQRQLLRLMSKEIFSDHEMLHALANRSAEERLAVVLLSLSKRFARRGLSPWRFRLPMSRSELSNYLGVAPETMSRLFRRFQERGWIASHGKELSLEDVRTLRHLAGQSRNEAPDRDVRSGRG
ncbi:Transcriptional activator protein Anr [wastewater metagenome]|uniref:Transcriptional activator protein Anr n=2 Tax=unclassified sequences TaxID=12908 RepID=A0A5B8RC69_9ZZZZ|nr:transcriptional activator protein Anr [uncultured organism]